MGDTVSTLTRGAVRVDGPAAGTRAEPTRAGQGQRAIPGKRRAGSGRRLRPQLARGREDGGASRPDCGFPRRLCCHRNRVSHPSLRGTDSGVGL